MVRKTTGASTPRTALHSFAPLATLAGSGRNLPAGTNVGKTPLGDVIEVTVRLRRKTPISAFVKKVMAGKAKPISRETFDKRYGASMQDITEVEKFARAYDLTIVRHSVATRSVVLKGNVQQFSEAFGVYLANFQPAAGVFFRGRTGNIRIPRGLRLIVEGVFGLDNRPQARPMFRLVKSGGRVLRTPAAAGTSYYANEVAKAYQYPKAATGGGQCIALIELGGGYRDSDIQEYFQKINLKTPAVLAQSVDGAHNDPSTPDSADGEVALDIQVAGAVAPGARIVVYFAPNSDMGFVDAVSAALHDKTNQPSVISISWGAAESQWTEQAISNLNDTFESAVALGVTITVAAGDNGSSDRQTDGSAHVDFPASSPFVLACGGTRLDRSLPESVWNDGDGWATGGGISAVFPVPSYQEHITLPVSVNGAKQKGRGLPDISANADSATGYNVLVDGQWSVIGGTSAVAPLIAGLIALINEQKKKPAGFIHTDLYAADAKYFKDITKGDNNTAKAGGYSAGPGWDACTGLGVPLGTIGAALKK